MVVAYHWPSSLISILALNLPLVAAYFPVSLHKYFKLPKNGVTQWQCCTEFRALFQDTTIVYMLSGPSDFLRQMLTMLSDQRGGTAHLRVIVSVEFSRRGASRKQIERAAQEGRALLVSFDLDTLVVGDAAVGGATDGRHLLGFGRNLGSDATPAIEPGLCLVLRHFLDGGVDGSFPVVARDSLPPLEAPARAVLLHDGFVRPEGLFPCRTPAIRVYAPSYRLRGRWVIRRLTTVEHLRLRQLPLSMDPLLSGLNSLHALPFEDSLSPEVFTSVFRQLWGATEGGCRVGNGGREEEDTTDGNDAEEESWSCLAVEHSRFEREIRVAACTWSATTRHRFGIGTPSQADLNVSLDGRTATGEASINSRANSCGGDDSMTASMTFSSWPDTSSHPSSANGWELDLSLMSEKQDGSLLTDEDTVTSVASEATLCRGRQKWDVDVEEHELGPSLPSNPGPPFKVGDVILCDIPGQLWGMDPMVNWLQRGFIMQAEHPNYKIRLERGATVWTNTSESWLQPRPLQGVGTDLAGDADDPFSDLRGDSSLRFGSYGIHLDAQRDSLTKVAEAKEFAKAVKADDAEVPKQLWNNRIRCPAGVSVELRDVALEGFRKLGHKWFLRGLIRDCVRFVRASYGTSWRRPRHTKDGELTMLGKDREAIASVIWHSVNTSWFDYHAGSTLIHFRFPAMYQEMARDGVKVFFEKPGPTTREAQPKIRDPKIREMAKEKIFKVLKRRYLRTLGIKIKSMIKYFAVPKGEDDIRMVYDATANHLNECVWVPTFWLPTIESLIRTLDQNSWMTDRDVGDMFLNFKLHWTVGPYTGVDLSPIYENDEEPGPRWAVWDRNLMGFAASPYSSVKMALVVEEVCRGNRREEGVGLDGKELNPFQWRVIRLNLPGTKDYDPCLPWTSKVRADGRIACDVSSFVDDERVGGPDEDLTWQASHKLASTQSYLGMQDAARKARLCSQQPGAWAGAIVHIVPELGVCVLTSLEKWLKLKTILKKWSGRIKCHQGEDKLQLDHKELLSDRGFLVYVTRTYPSMVPYLKGFHLTIEMWRGGRDAEGWKLRERDLDTVASEQSFDTVGGQEDLGPGRNEDEDMAGINHRIDVKRGKVGVHAPADGLTTPVPRFKDDVAALLRLTDFDLPPLRVVRPTQVVQVFYGFGDASGKQFGATLSENYNCRGHLSGPAHGSDRIRCRIGLWSPEVEEESSNYKELRNLVESIGDEARAGRLRDCELFVFTDNSTAEGCFHRGTSKSVHLHALVLELRTLEMIYGMTLHVVHISGKRMIAQGTDGCSRGSLMEGVMAGQDMLSFIDLSRTAIERHPPILKWVRSWTGRPGLAPLPAEGWFEEGHGMVGGCLDGRGVWIPSHEPKNGLHLWSPPPAVADVALEELLKARHKRTDTFHVVLIPRLMTPRWRRLFAKACDFTFVVSPGASFWPDDMFEPLYVGVILPFTQHRPWSFKRAPILVEMGRDLREVLLKGEGDGGDILRKLLQLPRLVAPMSERMACGVLHVPGRAAEVPHNSHRGRVGKPVAQGGGEADETRARG